MPIEWDGNRKCWLWPHPQDAADRVAVFLDEWHSEKDRVQISKELITAIMHLHRLLNWNWERTLRDARKMFADQEFDYAGHACEGEQDGETQAADQTA